MQDSSQYKNEYIRRLGLYFYSLHLLASGVIEQSIALSTPVLVAMDKEFCVPKKVKELETLLRVILNLLVQTQDGLVDHHVWRDILQAVEEIDADLCILSPVFATVIKGGQYHLVELFCSLGMNPFSRPHGGKSAAIFGLASESDCVFDDKGYSRMFEAIFMGMRTYWMKKVAGLKEMDFSSGSMNDSKVWKDTGTLLERAVVTKPRFARYLIKNSDPDVASAAGATPLHRAILHNDEYLIKELIDAGLDPNAVGSIYLTDDECWDHPTLADQLIDRRYHNERWWDDLDCWDMAAMLKKPNTAFLAACRKAYFHSNKSISMEVHVDDDQSDLDDFSEFFKSQEKMSQNELEKAFKKRTTPPETHSPMGKAEDEA